MTWPDLPRREQVTLAELRSRVGSAVASVWLPIEQSMMDRFADVTGDDAFIHIDPERAVGSRFGGVIAHGLLVLSLLAWLLRSAHPLIRGSRAGVNYGYENVRFLMPVPVGSRIRGHFTLVGVEQRRGGLTVLRYDVTVEIEGEAKPALVCTWLLGEWIDAD